MLMSLFHRVTAEALRSLPVIIMQTTAAQTCQTSWRKKRRTFTLTIS